MAVEAGDKNPVVVIVGGGFSGAFCAAELAAKAAGPVRIVVVEPRPVLGAGVAYSAADPAHRINVPAARMTLFPEDPTHFDRWLRAGDALAGDAEALWSDGHAYPRREVFGRYVAGLVETCGRRRADVTITHLRDEAVSARVSGDGYVVKCRHGPAIAADVLVLAVSHPPPAAPPAIAALGEDAAIIGNPWAPGALDAIPADDEVLIVGTGLTMADVVASLARRGHRGRMTAISRRGQLSRGHAFGAAPFAWFAANEPPRRAAALTRQIRVLVGQAGRDGLPWQVVLDDVRANAKLLWDALDVVEKRRLLRHLRPFWDSHRYRVAPQVERAVAGKRADGSLVVLAASLVKAVRRDGRFGVTLHRRRPGPAGPVDLAVDTIIVTTGPAHGGLVASHPVLASLAAAGALRADALGLGVEVDARSRAMRADGGSDPRLYVAGPLARARFGELMGLPQVAAQPSAVAAHIAAGLSSR
jgi:uncharacterized NAD(P)/FAD-binding protein YdhS